MGICEIINEELDLKQKLYVMVQLLDFVLYGAEITSNEMEFIDTVSISLNIPSKEYRNLKNFVLKSSSDVPEKDKVMIIDNNNKCELEGAKHLFIKNLKSTISLLYLASINKYILRYTGNVDLFLNGQNIFPGQSYTFDHGSTIRGSGINAIYFNDVANVFSNEKLKNRLSLEARNVNLRFKKSENGIQNFNFYEETGNLVGVLGGSGVGKTTILNILSWITEPQSGEVLINGFNLYSSADRNHLKGVVGFVPQDDLLIEELSVYQNLYYSARMCLDNLTENELKDAVNRTLTDLDLNEIRDLKVGNSLNKVISGGQRKRLNIALELIREPTILFVDEPTSGLSSVDSEIVLNLLKEQTYRGKLVIINIHQPGSDLYKMFDKVMLIDKGGYQIFYGNPSEAIVYFKTKSSHANACEDQCVTCGNVNSDQLLHIIEAKVVDENGKHTNIRKVAPYEWAGWFNEKIRKVKPRGQKGHQAIPENIYSVPGLMKQSRIYFIRDLLAKIANRQYVMICLFGAPFLAFLLSFFTKTSSGGNYLFSENDNLPAYLFMSVITSLFLGLIISAEEIIRDRKILKRESFLNLSWFSYLNSKIMMMFLISAIQTLSFILIGNYILEIKGMTISYWLIFFTTSCFANLMGLNISAAFNSAVTIYILIPFFIIPQLLFSGVLVKFDKLNQSSSTTEEYVPLIGNTMAARWSFEALAVEQFSNNRFERNFFKTNIEKSQNDWYANFLIPTLKKKLWECRNYSDSAGYRDRLEGNFHKLIYHIDNLAGLSGFTGLQEGWKESLSTGKFNPDVAKATENYLDSLAGRFKYFRKENVRQLDSITKSIVSETGKEEFIALSNNYKNKSLEDLLLDRNHIGSKTFETDTRIVQKFEPVYMKPTSNFGQAHFYSPYKLIGSIKIDTYWFNIIVLWIATFILYIILYYNYLQKAVNFMTFLRSSYIKMQKQL
ncbi:MAG: ATP-binding cassette domain-containing protein [Bacteroidia bacterium]|nr:ATP-binding cassette domain-containing protein [Bacteroidia bacterium]